MNITNVEILGGYGISCEGEPLKKFANPYAMTLFAYLLLTSQMRASRDTLSELFWPMKEQKNQDNALSKAIWAIRKHLTAIGSPGPEVIKTENREVVVAEYLISCDALLFDRFPTASARSNREDLEKKWKLYKGDLLPGIDMQWADDKREPLKNEYANLLEYLVQHYLEDSADYDMAMPLLKQLTERKPYCQAAWCARIYLESVQGRRNKALDLFDTFDLECGQEPNAKIVNLVKQIQCGEAVSPADLLAFEHPIVRRAIVDRTVQPSAADEPSPYEEPLLRPHQVYATKFVGRKTELERLVSLLQEKEQRLITLVGTGGVGKTRFAIEAVRQARLHAAFVPLEDVSSPHQLLPAIAQALSLELHSEQEVGFQVAQKLRSEPTLLILDNMEHLLGDLLAAHPGVLTREEEVEANCISAILADLLKRVPSLVCLVTSHRPVGLTCEYEMDIQPLQPPPVGTNHTDIMKWPSAELFIERARLKKPDFVVTSANVEDLVAICQELDGLPLAIEMAASMVKPRTLKDIRQGIQQQLTLEMKKGAVIPPRQRKLRATVEYCFQSLPVHLQNILPILSVFRGGWTVDAADYIADGRVGDCLDGLYENSLIFDRTATDFPRWGLLEVMRQLAWENWSLYTSCSYGYAMRTTFRSYWRPRNSSSLPRIPGLP